jgi:N-acetyl-anhydromuramyl-L-alanine amidase AmpD
MTNPLDNMKTPEVKFNKNGYEIRADILALAKDQVVGEFQAKFAGWELKSQKDEKTGQLVTTVEMPEYPGVDKILEAAEKMYSFVNAGIKK